jgi:hypothetical protein
VPPLRNGPPRPPLPSCGDISMFAFLVHGIVRVLFLGQLTFLRLRLVLSLADRPPSGVTPVLLRASFGWHPGQPGPLPVPVRDSKTRPVHPYRRLMCLLAELHRARQGRTASRKLGSCCSFVSSSDAP